MNDLATVRVTFTCPHCGSTNELTAAYVHEATVVHCSKCRASIAPLRLLSQRPAQTTVAALIKA